MPDTDDAHGLPTNRDHLGWWLFVVLLLAALAYVAVHVVGILVLGVFGYYATRPICTRVRSRVDSDSLAALFTVLVVLVPVSLLLVALAVRAATAANRLFRGGASSSLVGQVSALDTLTTAQRARLRTLVEEPASVFGGQAGSVLSNGELAIHVLQAAFGTVLLVGLAVLLSYTLLARDGTLSDVFVDFAGGRETAAYAYAAAVDEDLESVFFGNLLFAAVMSLVAVAAYWVTNALAPAGLGVPMILVLGFLTGVTSLVPVVVGKLVYVPVVALLAVQAVRTPGSQFAFVGTALVAYVLALDVLPQSFVQPYLSGRQVDMLLLLFAYLVGPLVFGWYGFFLLPILFVLVLEAVRIALPELLRGETPRARVRIDVHTGTDPVDERPDVPDQTASATPDEEDQFDSSRAADPDAPS